MLKIRKRVILGLLIAITLVLYCRLALAQNPGSDITLCTSTVDQSSCYQGSYPTPTLNWTISGSSSQAQYQVQIDNNSDFSSPEIDTGWVVSTDDFYTVASSGLSFETSYYWRVRVIDDYSSQTNWAAADSSFETSAQCVVGASDLSVSKGDYCASPSHYFSWTFSPSSSGESNVSGFAWSDNIGWVCFNSDSDGSETEYGTNISEVDGDLSGYAWSENIGWISFNRSETGNPPASPFNGGSGPIAQYDSGSGDLTGWMKALSYGDSWDGWIRFEDASIDGSGDWQGWAWSDLVVGWLSLNGSGYKVILSDYESLEQSKFQLQVDNNSDFASPEVDMTVESPSQNQAVVVATSPGTNQLAYNTVYYWRLKIWDSNEVEYDWATYNDAGDEDGDGNAATFTTELHRYPYVEASWLPVSADINEEVSFTDESVVYGGATKSSWAWTFQDGSPGSSSDQNPTVQFTSGGTKTITLSVTDSDGFSCPLTAGGSASIVIEEDIPGWREILPW